MLRILYVRYQKVVHFSSILNENIQYRSPDSVKIINQEIDQMLREACCLNSNFKMVVEDFNSPSINWIPLLYLPLHDDFMETVFELHLHQLVTSQLEMITY